MTGFEKNNGVLCADGVPLPDIAKEVGTPSYVYSAATIKAQYDALNNALKKALPADRQPMLCYACKANSNIAIIKYLKQLGCDLEIVSEGELIRGLEAGFAGNQIVATGVGKQQSEIAACLEAGIHQFNVESIPELLHINEIASKMDKTATIVFRLNPNIANAAFSKKTSTGGARDKFGIGPETVFEGFKLSKTLSHIDARGLSVHIGSQITKVDSFAEAFQKLPDLVSELRAQGYIVDRLDIGGGFPIIYKDEDLLDLDRYAEWVRDIILPLETEIIMEPGRYLVGNAGVLLTETIYVKETQQKSFLVLDSAMNDLVRPAMYNAWHGIEPVENHDRADKIYDIVGPICETGDTFTKDRSLPEIKAGELAVIHSAGAYGMCMASNYNTRPMPAEVFAADNNFTIIRHRQSLSDIIEKDIIPDWLK